VEGIGLWVNHIRLSRSGDVIQGIVVDTRIISRRNKRYFLTYEYSPKDSVEMLIQEAEVSEIIFEGAPIGTSVFVRYLPLKPEVSNIDGNNSLWITGLGMEMVFAPMVLLTGLLIGLVYISRRVGWL